jgi:hypothetical protein
VRSGRAVAVRQLALVLQRREVQVLAQLELDDVALEPILGNQFRS